MSPNPRGRPPTWDQPRIIVAIQAFVQTQERVPGYRDFQQALHGLPPRATVERFWPRWQDAVRAAGYAPPPDRRQRLVLGWLLWWIVSQSPQASLASHAHWTDHYQDEHGIACCKLLQDCQPVPIRVLQHGPDETVVEIAGHQVTLATKAVHRSETTHTYWCARDHTLPPTRAATRCVFYAVAG